MDLNYITLVASPAIRRAADRCFANPPMVFPVSVDGRTYAVRSTSKPDLFYRVDLKLAADGQTRLGHCGCEAGRRQVPCKHLIAALSVHLGILGMRKTRKAAV